MDSGIKRIQTLFTKIDPHPQNQSDLYLMRTIEAIRDLKKFITHSHCKNNELSILDIGCGNGYVTCLLSSVLGDIIACDFEVRERVKAKSDWVKAEKTSKWRIVNKELRNLRIQFVNCDGLELPFQDSGFSIITSFGVLEHVGEFEKNPERNEERFIKEVFRVLKAGGIFIIFYLPNKWTYVDPIAKSLRLYYHRRKFTKRNIEALCSKAGFEVVQINRRNFVIAQHHKLGRKIGDFLNNFAFPLYIIDKKLCLDTPLSLFANDFHVITQKRLI